MRIAVELIASYCVIVGARLGTPSSVRTLTISLAGPTPTLLTTETVIRYDSHVIRSMVRKKDNSSERINYFLDKQNLLEYTIALMH